MMEWTVTGPFKIAGVPPGGIVTDQQLEGTDISHLVDTGHLTPTARPAKADKATTLKE